ncbi:hypothetical protein [Kordiimonas aestuarii]|uniref:hypothetical protein n=1 Tax=Kordiimonas aestuarii TaxID=1005925 RepID=UPI0021D3B371|nr:hypothetical protein [Kordiimonas aestuarii]
MFENPIGATSGIMGPPSFHFDPCDYGGYLPEDDLHPDYPEYLPPRDAYRKHTNIWCGGGFREPRKRPVPSLPYFPGWKKLGGKAEKTKRVRSATPRGFAIAVFEANARAGGKRRMASPKRLP